MKFFGKSSDNIEDARGSSGGGRVIGGGIGILIVVVGMFFGKDLTGLVSEMPVGNTERADVQRGTPDDVQGKFVANVLASTDQVWMAEFQQMGKEYEK
ncbi:MAG TPA: neutral zinc metallopeptidase, partial [Pedobacter sp.]